MTRYYDMHCHLDFCDDCKQIAEEVADAIVALDATVLPSSFVGALAKFEIEPNVRVGLGLHPWEVAEGHVGEVEIAAFENLIDETNYVAEIGLDYYKDRIETRDHQLDVLARLFQAIKDAQRGKVVFLHSVKSNDDMLKMLDTYKLTENNIIVFHWFQGTVDELTRAINKGCLFSVGKRMAGSAKGKDLIAQIPNDRLLIESDSPAHLGDAWSALDWTTLLDETYEAVAECKNITREELDETIKQNSLTIL